MGSLSENEIRLRYLVAFWSDRIAAISKKLDEWEWIRPEAGRFEELTQEEASALRVSDMGIQNERVYLAVGLVQAQTQLSAVKDKLRALRGEAGDVASS